MVPKSLYCATSRTSGKMYVGITKRPLAVRWRAHCYSARRGYYGDYVKFHKAIAKYGPADFELILLHTYPSEREAADAEIALIAILELQNKGYNCTPGGDLGQAVGQKRSEAFKKACSDRMKLRAQNPEWIAKMREVARIRAQNPEYIKKLSAANTGKKATEATRAIMRKVRATMPPPSEETKRKMSDSHRGRKASPEAIANMRAAQKGRTVSPEHAAKIAAKLRGRPRAVPLTPEQCRNLSEAKKRYWASLSGDARKRPRRKKAGNDNL